MMLLLLMSLHYKYLQLYCWCQRHHHHHHWLVVLLVTMMEGLMTTCCAECGKEEERVGGVSLKACKACMQVKYCNAGCQHKHWPKHKTTCKLRAAELYAKRRCSKTHEPRRNVPFASYQCQRRDWFAVSRFQTRLYCQYWSTNLRLQMRSWQ